MIMNSRGIMPHKIPLANNNQAYRVHMFSHSSMLHNLIGMIGSSESENFCKCQLDSLKHIANYRENMMKSIDDKLWKRYNQCNLMGKAGKIWKLYWQNNQKDMLKHIPNYEENNSRHIGCILKYCKYHN